MSLCVIPARGGSKRIPRKNVRPFVGRPVVSYSIRSALESAVFDRVVVSTDDDEIAQTALEWGAAVPFRRPPHLADDQSGTNPVVAHAISELRRAGEEYDFVACVYATAPFLEPETIRAGLDLLRDSDAAFAVTVATFPYPIQRALGIGPEGRIGMLRPEHRATRSQDLQEAYHDAGQLYWGRADAFVRGTPMFHDGSTIPIPVPRQRVQDIDTPEDWARAEAMFRALQLTGRGGG